MRPILFAASLIGAASVLASTDAMAQSYAEVFGPEFYGPSFYGTRPVHVRSVRKKRGYTKNISTKHVSIVCPAVTTGISTGPPTRTAIPLPDQALLTPQPEFDCEFKTITVDGAADQPQPSPTRAHADANIDAALRKLEYERECYRNAEIILRDRLRLLQVAVGETIKAAILGTEAAQEPSGSPAVIYGPPEGH